MQRLDASATTKRNELVVNHLSSVTRIARRLAKHLPAHCDFDDLQAAGVFGLLDAATTFDVKRDTRFSRFASNRIRGAMIDHLRAIDTLSRDSRRVANEVKRATRDATIALGRLPGPVEIAAQLGITIEALYKQQKKLAGDVVVPLDDGTHDMLDALVDAKAIDPLTTVIKRERTAILEAAIRTLPGRMQTVLSLLYRDELTHKEIGKVLGFTESRSCQIAKEATRILQEKLNRKLNT